jgi:hypothetical protein
MKPMKPMTRVLLILACAMLVARPAAAHVGSPDVFFEGDAGPYHLYVTVRTPDVIPGVAQIEVRTDADVTDVSVVPMQLTGPGSTLPPTPDHADRVSDTGEAPMPDRSVTRGADPRFFTAGVWLMEPGSLQVRLAVDGARGAASLAVPVPAVARTTLAMNRGLGVLLFALMLLLAFGLIAIAAGAAREVALEPGAHPEPRARRRTRIAAIGAGAVIAIVVALGNWWWDAEAGAFAEQVERPLHPKITASGCHLSIAPIEHALMEDHGHLVHLFLVREPAMDAMAHLHPWNDGGRATSWYEQDLPTLPAGRYRAFADIVLAGGYPMTGTTEVDVPGDRCPAPTGDDAVWTGAADPDARIVFDAPPELRAGVATSLRFHVVDAAGAPAALEPYMGMAGHAAIVAPDGSVFAHIHPSGTVAMPALALAQGMDMGAMHMPDAPIPSTISFPYGFPRAGAYRIFVQVKHAGRVVTGAFDVRVE